MTLRLLLSGCFVAVSFLLVSCTKETSKDSEQLPTTNRTEPLQAPTAGVPAEFQKLAGRWERPDGGYILELKNAESSGKFEASYQNPGPIHVAKALALKEGGKTKLFVELRDVNYPGCTYSLEYDPQTDQLFGQYFQAAVQQTYDVVFARLK